MNVYATNPRRNGGQISRRTDRDVSRIDEKVSAERPHSVPLCKAPGRGWTRPTVAKPAAGRIRRTAAALYITGRILCKVASRSARIDPAGDEDRHLEAPALQATLHNISYRTL